MSYDVGLGEGIAVGRAGALPGLGLSHNPPAKPISPPLSSEGTFRTPLCPLHIVSAPKLA